MDRLTRHLARRNGDILAVVTSQLESLEAIEDVVGSSRARVGDVESRAWLLAGPGAAVLELELRVTAAAAAAALVVTFQLDLRNRAAQFAGSSFPGGARASQLAERPVRRAVVRALEANGYAVDAD